MIIKEFKARSILNPSKLSCDYVVNPYVGCSHGCIYCYAGFMKRFTNHPEPWGEFVDVKVNAAELVPRLTFKYENKSVLFSSVTDCYQPLEGKYRLMPNLLKAILPLNMQVDILTKSNLVLRDIELLKRFKHIKVGVSLSTLSEKIQKEVEPGAVSPQKRIEAVKVIHNAGLSNFIFISPILPGINNF